MLSQHKNDVANVPLRIFCGLAYKRDMTSQVNNDEKETLMNIQTST